MPTGSPPLPRISPGKEGEAKTAAAPEDATTAAAAAAAAQTQREETTTTKKKKKSKLDPLEEQWECQACHRLNPCWQKLPGSKSLFPVENCRICKTERPMQIFAENEDDVDGPSAAELAALKAEKLKAALKTGIIAAWTKKKREREARLQAELGAMKPLTCARTCLKPFVPGPFPRKVPPLEIDESKEPGTLVTFVCRHGMNGAPTRRVPVDETCPYCRALAEKRLWAWLQGHFIMARAFEEMEFGETQTVRYWGDKVVGAEKRPIVLTEEEKEEIARKEAEEKRKAEEAERRRYLDSDSDDDMGGKKKDRGEEKGGGRGGGVGVVTHADIVTADGYVEETFDYRDWPTTLGRLNDKDTFAETTLLCLAFEPATFWNAIRFYDVASAAAERARIAMERGEALEGGVPAHAAAAATSSRAPKMTIRIKSAKGLRKADYFGLSDPYCIVYFAGKEVGRTEIIPDNLDPEWSAETATFVIDTAGVDWTTARLRIDVWDSDFMVQNPLTDDFLGQVRLSGSQLRQLIHVPPEDRVTRYNKLGLRVKPKDRTKILRLERRRGQQNESALLAMKDSLRVAAAGPAGTARAAVANAGKGSPKTLAKSETARLKAAAEKAALALKITGTLSIEGRLDPPKLTPQERRRLKRAPERGQGEWAVACRSWREVALKKWDALFVRWQAERRELEEALKVPALLEPVLTGVFSHPDEIEEFRQLVNAPRANAEIDDRGPFGYTALHLAAQKNLPEIAEILVEAGASIDPYDSAGSTPLHMACAAGYSDLAVLLQGLGADVFRKDRANNDAFDICLSCGMHDTGAALSKALVFEEEILWRARRYYKDLMSGRADHYDSRHLTRRHDQGRMLACVFATRKTKKMKQLFKSIHWRRRHYMVYDLYDPTKLHEIGMALFGHKPSTVPAWPTLVKNWNSVGDIQAKRGKRLKDLRSIYVHVLGYMPGNPLKGMEGGVAEFLDRLDHARENVYENWLRRKGTPEVDVEFEMNFGKKKGQKRAEKALAELLGGRKAGKGKKNRGGDSDDGKNKKKKKKKKKKKTKKEEDEDGDAAGGGDETEGDDA